MRTKTLRVFSLIFFIMLVLTLFYNSVYASSTTITIDNWDSYGAGVKTGTGSYGTWTSIGSAETSTDYDFSAPNSLKVKADVNTKVWYNLTVPINISGMDFEMRSENVPAADSQMFVELRNNSIDIIRFKFDFKNTVQDVFVYDYASSTYKTLTSDSNDWYQKHIKFGFKNNYTVGVSPINSVYYYMKGAANNTIFRSCEWTWNGSQAFDMRNVDQIRIYSLYTQNYVYFDDIIFDVSPSASGSNPCDFSNDLTYYTGSINSYSSSAASNKYLEIRYLGQHSWNITGFKILVDDSQIDITTSQSDYYLYINGIPCGMPSNIVSYIDAEGNNRYYILWCGLDISTNSEQLLFEISNTHSVGGYYWYPVVQKANSYNGLGYYHNVLGNFGNGNIDGSPLCSSIQCYIPTSWIYYKQNLAVSDNIEAFNTTYYNYLHTLFGDFFIQFAHFEDKCYYGVGDTPDLLINISNVYFSSTDGYRLIIKHVSSNFTAYVYDLVFTSNSLSGWYELPKEFKFSMTGQYRIYVYNITDGNTDELLAISDPLTVCEYGSGGTDETDETDDDLIRTTADYTPTIAFVACLCIGLFAGFITMNGTAFAAGFLGSIMFMSIPDQPFTYFPIAVLAIVGFILVIMFMYMLFRR